MKPVEKIHTVELFPPLSSKLLSLLRSLPAADWAKPTVCPAWSVKDIVAHLLGGNIGRLWQYDDASLSQQGPVLAYDELVSLIDKENHEWVQATRRISPEILIEFLELTDRKLYQRFSLFDEDKPARIAVAWAGHSVSPYWFDIAREYTEKWLHQQHIREAVGKPLLSTRRWLFPVLDTFIRGLPYTYREVTADEGAAISVHIVGEAGGDWSLLRQNDAWHLFSGLHPGPVSRIRMNQDLAWRLFTKGIRLEAARSEVQIDGDASLGERILCMVSIMA